MPDHCVELPNSPLIRHLDMSSDGPTESKSFGDGDDDTLAATVNA